MELREPGSYHLGPGGLINPLDRWRKLRGCRVLRVIRLLSLDSKAGLPGSKDEKNPYRFSDPIRQIGQRGSNLPGVMQVVNSKRVNAT